MANIRYYSTALRKDRCCFKAKTYFCKLVGVFGEEGGYLVVFKRFQVVKLYSNRATAGFSLQMEVASLLLRVGWLVSKPSLS